MRDFSKEIEAYALQNAIEFGKTDIGRILPKLFQHGLAKEDIKEIIPIIKEFVNKVNKLDNEQKEKEGLIMNFRPTRNKVIVSLIVLIVVIFMKKVKNCMNV